MFAKNDYDIFLAVDKKLIKRLVKLHVLTHLYQKKVYFCRLVTKCKESNKIINFSNYENEFNF